MESVYLMKKWHKEVWWLRSVNRAKAGSLLRSIYKYREKKKKKKKICQKFIIPKILLKVMLS